MKINLVNDIKLHESISRVLGNILQEEISDSVKIEMKQEYEKAQRAIHAAPTLGEIGNLLRGRKFVVYYDGFSTCTFRSKYLFFFASNYEQNWKLSQKVYFKDSNSNDHKFNIHDIDSIDLSDVQQQFTPKERMEKGMVNKEEFRVYAESNRTRKLIDTFDSFEQAKQMAYQLASAEAKEIKDSRDGTSRYAIYPPRDESDTHLCYAAYEFYNSDGHRYWYAVE